MTRFYFLNIKLTNTTLKNIEKTIIMIKEKNLEKKFETIYQN